MQNYGIFKSKKVTNHFLSLSYSQSLKFSKNLADLQIKQYELSHEFVGSTLRKYIFL